MPVAAYLADLNMDQFAAANVVLYTVAPTDSTPGTQVSGGSYSPQSSNILADVDDPNTGSNTAPVLFTGMPACTVVAMGLISAGNLLYYDVLGSPKTYTAGEATSIPIGTLVVTITS